MGDMLKLIWWAVITLFRSRASLEAEILTLRHQLNVLRRKSPKLRIPIQSGRGFRFDPGHRSDLMPAAIPK